MGIITIIRYIVGRAAGTRRLYQSLAQFRGARKTVRFTLRNQRRARRADRKRTRVEQNIFSLCRQFATDTNQEKKRQAEIGKALKEYSVTVKKEITLSASVLVGDEALLYIMKEQGIGTLLAEIKKIEEGLFPDDILAPIILRLEKLQQEYERDLDDIRAFYRKESRGRFQLATLSLRSEKRFEREMVNDLRRLRGVVHEIDASLEQLHDAELHGQIAKTSESLTMMIASMERELALLMEVAQDDVIVMHRLKQSITSIQNALASSKIDKPVIDEWIKSLQQISDFETQELNRLRLSTKSLDRRERQAA